MLQLWDFSFIVDRSPTIRLDNWWYEKWTRCPQSAGIWDEIWFDITVTRPSSLLFFLQNESLVKVFRLNRKSWKINACRCKNTSATEIRLNRKLCKNLIIICDMETQLFFFFISMVYISDIIILPGLGSRSKDAVREQNRHWWPNYGGC